LRKREGGERSRKVERKPHREFLGGREKKESEGEFLLI
jgi:hypothetical protein